MKNLRIPFLMLLLCPAALFGGTSEPAPLRTELPSGQDSINGVYIPVDIYDAMRAIDGMTDDGTRRDIITITEEEFTGLAHLGLGILIRNEWGLWSGSRLSEYFNRLGICHPDNMSGIILTCYYRQLTGKPLKIKKQAARYKKSQKKSARRHRKQVRENGNGDG